MHFILCCFFKSLHSAEGVECLSAVVAVVGAALANPLAFLVSLLILALLQEVTVMDDSYPRGGMSLGGMALARKRLMTVI